MPMKRYRPRFEDRRPEYPDRDDADERKLSLVADVLHHDDAIVVVNKPPYLSLDVPIEEEATAIDQLREAGVIGADETPLPAYMLEPRLSGLAVLARSERSLEALRTQISGGEFDIICLTLVRGRVESAEGVVEQPVRERSRTNPLLMVDAETGSPAQTRYRRRDGYVGAALLECSPRPADPNIVRVHLQYSGLPLMVDPSYGGANSLKLSSFKGGYRPSARHPERPLIERVSMHVAQATFAHPVTGTPVAFEAALHRDMKATLYQLDRYGRAAK